MRAKEIIEDTISHYNVCEYAFGKTSDIPFSSRVRTVCETDCERYGKCWACPPYCGAVDECMQKCRRFSDFCLFSTVTEVDDAWNTALCLKAKRGHETLSLALRDELRGSLESIYVLSTGCSLCEVCACPDAKCRFPDKRLSSMESHGIVIVELAEKAGLSTGFGGDTVVYFSIILFNDK